MVAGVFDCVNILLDLLDNHIIDYTAYMTDMLIDDVPIKAFVFENEKKHTKEEYDAMIATKTRVIQSDRFDRCAFACQELSGLVPKDYWCQGYSDVFYDFNDLSGARGKVIIQSDYKEIYNRVGEDVFVNFLSHRMKEYVANIIEDLISTYHDTFCEYYDMEILKQKCNEAYTYFEEYQKNGFIEIFEGNNDVEFYVTTKRTGFSKEKMTKLELSYTDGAIIEENDFSESQLEKIKSNKMITLKMLYNKITDFVLSFDYFEDMDYWIRNYEVFLK